MATLGDMRGILREFWGYDRFRPLQEEAMEAVLRGEDSLVILPTGGGKSLCFQAPALAMEGTAVVVTPLISLMKDQVDALGELGIAAGKLHSGQSPEEARGVWNALRAGELKLLYVSPERLVLEGFAGISRGAALSFMAVDEAHCISEWGHDFRPEYRRLREFRDAFPSAAIHAFTATATPRVAEDIRRQLGLKSPKTLVGSFDRPNLFYRVERRVSAVDQIAEVEARHKGESGIVYCISRKETEKLAEELNARGIAALPYHAGLEDGTRERNQNAFINDRVAVMVATIAFGMGIDKPDVRFVVHAGMPKSLENYQQESGRAGRDGLAAECVLLHAGGDFMKWKFIVGDQPPEQQRTALENVRAVERYCESLACRRAALLRHFGEEYGQEKCPACDVCAGEMVPLADSLTVAQKILSCAKRLNEAHGASYTAKVLVAAKDAKIAELGHAELSTHGILGEYDRGAVKGWIEQLLSQGFLERKGDHPESALGVTARGWEALRGRSSPVLIHSAPKKAAAAAAQTGDDWVGVDKELFGILRDVRSRLATERNVPPYVIFGDRSLRDFARCRPLSAEVMLRLHGVGDAKMQHYGEAFLSAIRVWCAAHPDAPRNLVPAGAPPRAPRATTTTSSGNGTRGEAMAMLRAGATVATVAAKTGRAPTTVENYLVDLIDEDAVGDPSRWVDSETARQVEMAADEDGTGRLRPIFEALGGRVPYWQIKVALACARVREKSA